MSPNRGATRIMCNKYTCRKLMILLNICITAFIFTYYSMVNTTMAETNNAEYLPKRETKYILQWTNKTLAPFNFMREGNLAFVKNRCKFTNCYVTNDRKYFFNEMDFDAVVFNGRDMTRLKLSQMPQHRNQKQKYIFGAMESADNFPVCDERFDNFFNWTWTYKLDSDFRWGYITIYDLNGTAVGPAVDMKWESEMEPISEDIKVKLSHKTKAAAWFVSHCKTKSRRENLVKEVKRELKSYNLTVDVYGRCGPLNCSTSNRKVCYNQIQKNYYFYFSLENSFAEDYVTEKLLNALGNYAIPIVYGAANYSRFLPPGSYLDGMELGAKELARQMNEIIKNQTLYHDFFRWRNYYTYKETSSKEDICKLCEMLNDEEKVAQTSVWPDFRTWWNGANYKKNCHR